MNSVELGQSNYFAGGDWDKFSDTGGYAHLISAASQYILWKQKKRDWEAHAVPK